jgi:uncharacterized protein YjbJ (UPF0337 family)
MGGVQSMDDKGISSAAKKVRGSITEALGKLTGDKTTEKQGTAQKKAAEAEMKDPETKTTSRKKSTF